MNFLYRKTFICCIIGFVFILGCAPAKEYVREEKSHVDELLLDVQDKTSIKYVDNFNDGSSPNMIGGEVFAKGYADGTVEIFYDEENVLGGSGYSLSIYCEQTKEGEKSEVVIELNDLDVSMTDGLSFWIKDIEEQENFRVIFNDSKGNIDILESDNLLEPSKDWQQVDIPRHKFKNINFNYMDKMTLRFDCSEKSASVFLDDIYFYGPPYMFFESLKDNLKNFPEKKIIETEEMLELSDRRLLKRIAKDTWRYFDEVVDKRNDMIVDYIDMNQDKIYRIGDYTSTTNLGLYFMCVISAWDLGFIKRDEAVNRIDRVLKIIENLPRWRQQWYNFYSTTNLQVTRRYVSSVDNGWLAAGLIVIRQTFPEEFKGKTTELLEKLNFSLLYDGVMGQLHIGYNEPKKKLSDYHYGFIVTETRIASLIGIGKGDIPKYHWFRVHRTPPDTWKWQTQIPKGKMKRYLGVDVFQGYYTYDDIKVVPSWGGSLFETLMPTLVIDEEKYAPKSFGLNNVRVAKIHRNYMLEKKKYPVWGLSPCSTPDGGYAEFGVSNIGIKGYEKFNVVTPHASILALPFMPDEVLDNIRAMLKNYDIYGEYGLYDSVNVNSGDISYKYLCLDQAMIFIQINNYLNNKIIPRRFHEDPIVKKAFDTIKREEFFKSIN